MTVVKMDCDNNYRFFKTWVYVKKQQRSSDLTVTAPFTVYCRKVFVLHTLRILPKCCTYLLNLLSCNMIPDMPHLDLIALIKTAGYLGLFAIIFAESGLFFGFFLPGDSLLFTAGVLASQDFLNIWLLVGLVVIGAILGDSVGYAFGNKIGYRIFYKDDSIFFNKKHIERASMFFEKHGRKTIILARFLPVIRTFVPILAGVGKMHYSTFLSFNIIGGILWGAGVTLIGFFFGSIVPDGERYLLPIVIAIIVVTTLPTAVEILKDPETRDRLLRILGLRKKN